MSTLGGLLGGQHEFTHGERTYKLGPLTQEMKLAYERYLHRRAKADAAKMLKDEEIDQDMYLELLKKINDSYMANEYAFDSSVGIRSLRSVPGLTQLTALLMGVEVEEVQAIAAKENKEKAAELFGLTGLIILESLPIPKKKKGEKEAATPKNEQTPAN